ncbi:peptidase family M48-domain-containing protein [Fimicolochytrium jonesii]|uniref:peptidase family M48-domain-containing protein n=1 Tax=Fimicolochytrium jonesii TaxID=1396493 RepID=UPI0022FF0099|nr:peptidase family M48-domain-containing protein [Fimicolochytrium jonesii]KAI8820959.1 peptidase family M48-domain-containing protein [Fimicolochytrium jonesii]
MWTLASIPLVIAAALIGSAYEQHPFTERSRLMFIDEPTELELAAAHSDSMVTKNRHLLLPTNHPDYILVHEIVSDLAAVAGPGRNWELHVLQSDDVVNAFVVPTGQIFVYTGLLRAAEDKDAVAAVIAHEFAHVLSRHGAEKLGIQHLAHLAWDFFHSLLYTLTLNLPIFSDIAGRGLDATKEVLTSLPYSRMCEKEADVIGLYLMSVAGYNPRAAIDFWAHLSRIDTSTSPTTTTPTTPPPTNKSHLLFKSPKSYEFLSDHPSHSTRASDLKQHLPAALKIYHARSVLAERVTHLRGRRLRRRDSAVGLAFGKDDTGDGETKVVTMEELNRDLFDVLKEHLSEAVESGGDAAWVRDEAVAMADKVVKARVVAL